MTLWRTCELSLVLCKVVLTYVRICIYRISHAMDSLITIELYINIVMCISEVIFQFGIGYFD
jgi:hypothetical protein